MSDIFTACSSSRVSAIVQASVRPFSVRPSVTLLYRVKTVQAKSNFYWAATRIFFFAVSNSSVQELDTARFGTYKSIALELHSLVPVLCRCTQVSTK